MTPTFNCIEPPQTGGPGAKIPPRATHSHLARIQKTGRVAPSASQYFSPNYRSAILPPFHRQPFPIPIPGPPVPKVSICRATPPQSWGVLLVSHGRRYPFTRCVGHELSSHSRMNAPRIGGGHL